MVASKNGVMDKSSFNPFPNVNAYGFNVVRPAKSPYSPKQNWTKLRYRSGQIEKLLFLPGPEVKKTIMMASTLEQLEKHP